MGLHKFGDISGETCHEKIVGSPVPCSFCKMPEAVNAGQITVNEVALPNDQHLLVQRSKAVTAGGRNHVIETITDVTKQKPMEEVPLEMRWVTGRWHRPRFNNLLTIINAHSEHLLQHVSANDKCVSAVLDIQGTVERPPVSPNIWSPSVTIRCSNGPNLSGGSEPSRHPSRCLIMSGIYAEDS